MPSPEPPAAGANFFPTTRWSRILAPGGARDLDQLARAYWQPMRASLATRLGPARAGAVDDLTHEAFAWLLATRFFERADPARGRFRAFLKTALQHFAIEQARRAAAHKRGGGHGHAPLDATEEPADPNALTPDQQLDAAWRRELLQRACADLQTELEASGRGVYFELFRAYFLAADDEIDHRTLAARHGISTRDVSNWLDHAKRRYRERLRALVQETVTDADELQAELRWLFGAEDHGR